MFRAARDAAATDETTSRRRFLAGGAAVGLTGLAGCTDVLGFVRGDDPADFEADAATVADATLEETGYELHELQEEAITREFEVAGRTREVQVTNHAAEYDRGVDLFDQRLQAAVFTALSTPQVNVLGQTFNPVGDMETDDFAEMIQDRYENVDDVGRAGEYTTDVLGTRATVVQYDAEADLVGSGLTVDLILHITEAVEVGDDFVLCLGAYPELIGDGDNVRRLLNGVEHPDA